MLASTSIIVIINGGGSKGLAYLGCRFRIDPPKSYNMALFQMVERTYLFNVERVLFMPDICGQLKGCTCLCCVKSMRRIVFVAIWAFG